MVQQSQRYLSSKAESCLVEGRNKQNKNSGVDILATIQETDNILLVSHNALVVLHAGKLVSLVTGHFGTDLQTSKPVPLEVCR